MSVNKENHLDEDQQIRAIIDETKIADSTRDHLASCPRCRAGMKKIQQELSNLGQTARRLAPVKDRRVSLPVKNPSRSTRRLNDWRISFGVIASTAVALFVLWPSTPSPTLHQDSLDIITQISWKDDDFMTEISALTENVLPQVYLDIIEESYLSIDDQFIRSVVPSTETGSLSYNRKRKGVKSC
ncbi:MAG: hypothetical protein KJO61_02350 [Deltaproteobacteria bacterium]|nr:hypothetical protein [Deltaproteobacteria bacterium]